jgi:3-oxoacyl-[acyl-carrier protein] reductase
MDPAGRTAIVTGAGSGIGRATALALASHGAKVAVVDVDVDGGQATVAEIHERRGTGSFHRADVGSLAQLTEVFRAVTALYGAVDILHNNAGIVSGAPDWPASAPERVRAVVEVNVLGVVLGTRLAIDAMAPRGGGVVINMSSLAATSLVHPDPVYAASKAAVTSFTLGCAPLAGSCGVRVNALVPGGVETPIINKTGDGTTPAAWLAARSHGPRLTPDDVARAVLAIVADENLAGETVVLRSTES